MRSTSGADLAAGAMNETSVAMIGAHPSGRVTYGENGTLLLVTGGVAAPFNRVTVTGHEPDVAEIDRFAGVLGEAGLAWSLWLRGEPGPEVLAVAAAHGLTERGTEPLMAVSRADARLRGPRPSGPAIRAITSSERQLHGDLMGTGYGVPAEAYLSFLAAPLMDASWATVYVAELDGVPVGTAYGVKAGDYIVVYSVAVLPEFRGRGYGRLLTERVMTDGFEGGATTAVLRASDLGMPMYKSMGFETVETWTYLT